MGSFQDFLQHNNITEKLFRSFAKQLHQGGRPCLFSVKPLNVSITETETGTAVVAVYEDIIDQLYIVSFITGDSHYTGSIIGEGSVITFRLTVV